MDITIYRYRNQGATRAELRADADGPCWIVAVRLLTPVTPRGSRRLVGEDEWAFPSLIAARVFHRS